VGNFLHGLFRDGAFTGATPHQSYFVVCDATTTTQDDIDQGRVNIVVGFAPIRPAEFVILRIGQSARIDDD
jgi:phage tail sheath protein FI